uniref:Uncharacterized protein n=1 Tax=Poecilia reticulata TaxID=8081 RepID=A0A3P9PLB8_POERE
GAAWVHRSRRRTATCKCAQVVVYYKLAFLNLFYLQFNYKLYTEYLEFWSVLCPDSVGPWLLWSQWSSCSVSCGGGQQSRSRTCTSPPCHGVSRQSKMCNTQLCPVDGGLSPWDPWSPCSLSCGGLGVKARSRTCTEPAPAHGGRDCQGPRHETTYCQAPDCPVDGGWSRWSPWSRCDQRCGGGRSIRTRSCSSPPPKNGGRKCVGEKNQVKPCNTKPCVDGAWTPWSVWSDCSVTCSQGTRVRTRACINPPPRNNGSLCSGAARESQHCQTPPCVGWYSPVGIELIFILGHM